MQLGSLFRQEAIEHRSAREPIDRVAQVTVPYDWVVLLILAALCFITVLWALFVKIDLTLPVDVIVIKPTDDRIVVSTVSARVSDVLVEEGARVEAGDALVNVFVPALHRRLSEAEERERVISDEIEMTDTYDTDLNRMLIESRAQSAALTKALENDEVILSPFSGQVFEVGVATGHVVSVGQEIVRIRVGESADTFAITFVPPTSVERISSESYVQLRCSGPHGDETLRAKSISDFPQNMIDPNFVSDAGFEPEDHQVSLILPESAKVANRTQCEGHIPLNPQTPLEVLLGGT